jgi:peptide/nickel transport system substrate-binding protein
VQPSLAESWTSNEDATVWTFQLRDDVEFQKGYGPMTSEDVKYSFDRLLDPEELGVRSSLYQNLESVETDGPHTVVMTLKQPDPLWVMGALLHHSASIISKKAHEEKGDEAYEKDPIGTGPYELVSVEEDPSQGVKLTASPTYWGKAPATPNIQVLYISDTTARTLALLSGDIHMMEGVRSPGWVPSMQGQAPDLNFDVASPGSFFTISFNLTVPPFDDVRVRQAMAYLIDRDRIAQAMAPFGQVPDRVLLHVRGDFVRLRSSQIPAPASARAKQVPIMTLVRADRPTASVILKFSPNTIIALAVLRCW